MSSEAPTKETLRAVGDYDLVQKIAEGGMGSVYKARHRTTGSYVAIKIVPPNFARNEILLKRFENEFRAASKLDHPNVVRAIEFGYEGVSPYLVMEFVDGESLGHRIERQGRLEEREAIRLLAEAAQGLHRAHKEGMVHRDVKPDNILINSEGRAKIADLGLVKEDDTNMDLTRTGRGLGTPHFMAPEQFRNAKNVDLRSDIYSLGATLYMAVTGELPFKSCSPLDAWMKKVHNELPTPKEVFPDVSERTDWAIRRAMSADPERRPASCREFVEDLTGRSTRPVHPEGREATGGFWYLYFHDEEGAIHTVKGSSMAIRRSLKEQLLGDTLHIRVARTKAGPFQALDEFPEFRDLVLRVDQPGLPPPSVDVLGDTQPMEAVAAPSVAPSKESLPHFNFGPVGSNHSSGWRTLAWAFIIAVVTALVALYFITE